MNEKDALHEALRLNRLYPNDYKRYKRAIKNLPKTLELQVQRYMAESQQIAQKDKKNAIIDELTDMCWYSYGDVVIKKAYVDKLIKKLLREKELDAFDNSFDNSFDNCSLEVGEHTQTKSQTKPLTQAELQEVIYYDAITGEFEWNTGVLSGKKVELKQLKPKPLRKQNAYAIPLKPRNFKPSHAGYSLISEQEYMRVMSGEDDVRVGVKYTGNGYLPKMERPQEVYMRHYLVRTKGGKSSDTQATKRITYYVKQNNNPYPRIKVKGKTYTAHSLATLYMGAGGDWDYSDGIDNIKKHSDHATTAPYGLKQYNPHTNRPMLMQCRDGNRLNLKWENIKPKYTIDSETNISNNPNLPPLPPSPNFSTASILKIPEHQLTAKHREVGEVQRRMYSHARNIKKVYLAYDYFNPRWTLVHMGNSYFYGWSEAEAIEEFNKRLAKMKGTKQRLRSGDIMVTTRKVYKE